MLCQILLCQVKISASYLWKILSVIYDDAINMGIISCDEFLDFPTNLLREMLNNYPLIIIKTCKTIFRLSKEMRASLINGLNSKG